MAHVFACDGTILDECVICVLPLSLLLLTLLVTVGWFTGLSSKFLSARTARLLVLAGAERLDKELMIGQMQGKFQLVVLAGVGHIVHEVSHGKCSHLKKADYAVRVG